MFPKHGGSSRFAGDGAPRPRAAAIRLAAALAVSVLCALTASAAEPPSSATAAPPATIDALLTPPETDGPVRVRARFELHDVNEINDNLETFEFTGVLTLAWNDPRLAFDPATIGIKEKVYQGNYQFNELAAGWYPQVVLVNEAGMYAMNGVVLRVRPNGDSTLIQTINATAEVDLNMHRFPFDGQRLEAVFEVLGFDRDEVLLEAESVPAEVVARGIQIPQWQVTGAELSVRDRPASYARRSGTSSAFVVSVDVQRDPFYVNRLVLAPLIVIVLLSFSVFWMDRSSLGDRISVSFIGILTGVAYQMVVSETMPRIAYVTLMHGLLNLSFLTMCLTVVINLVVGSLDKRGEQAKGDRIDAVCRWLFPIGYFAVMAFMIFIAQELF